MTEITGSTRPCRRAGPGCVECTQTPAGGSTCAVARRAGTSGAATPPPPSTRPLHYTQTGHELVQSFEPGEDWFWSYRSQQAYQGPALAPPTHHPVDQPAPGPRGLVPPDWQAQLH